MPNPAPCSSTQATIAASGPRGTKAAKPTQESSTIARPPRISTRSHRSATLAISSVATVQLTEPAATTLPATSGVARYSTSSSSGP